MKKIRYLSFFISLIFASFTIAGCTTINFSDFNNTPIPTTSPTAAPTSSQNIVSYLYLDSDDGVHGNVYMDGVYKGYLPPNGTLNLYNLQVGNHTLTIETLPNISPTITVLYDGQNIYINWSGNVWW